MFNSMITIEIYRHAGTWCFTDEARGLLHEPFVLGIPKMIDKLIENIEDQKNKTTYAITFSERQFPTCSTRLTKLEEEHGGAWYELNSESNTTERGWLCPATLKFFSNFPDEIYFTLNAMN